MAVCVGNDHSIWKGKKWWHLMATTVEELHEFAAKIGLKRSWYQPQSTPHYDVTAHYRQKAVEAGAAELDRAGIVSLCRLYRERGQC
jgi:hypothetical protein